MKFESWELGVRSWDLGVESFGVLGFGSDGRHFS